MNKLPQITLVFRVMKVRAITMGSSDVLAAVLVVMIAGALYAQRRYVSRDTVWSTL
ncbi:hypothetical protein [Pseudomonas tolaasii]|uniref:hypothetical protein n=1 Tax=Pseudomonas tolaasii TaxID=29442 RepID=UPI001C5D1D51|nr:hypothetical protein [Pseudomonas tolaasii]MBW4795315.1 hypothetical protein [Pseudomonas tolaasii]